MAHPDENVTVLCDVNSNAIETAAREAVEAGFRIVLACLAPGLGARRVLVAALISVWNQRSVHSDIDALVQSDRNQAANVVALYKALGGGWEPEAAATRPVDEATQGAYWYVLSDDYPNWDHQRVATTLDELEARAENRRSKPVRAEPVEAPSSPSGEQKQDGPSTSSGRTDGGDSN